MSSWRAAPRPGLEDDDMRSLNPCVACVLLLGILAGCQKPAKMTQQDSAIAGRQPSR